MRIEAYRAIGRVQLVLTSRDSAKAGAATSGSMKRIISLADTYSENELNAAMERGIAWVCPAQENTGKAAENPLSLPSVPKEPMNELSRYTSVQNAGVEQRDLSYYGGYGA
mgnify:FL=1